MLPQEPAKRRPGRPRKHPLPEPILEKTKPISRNQIRGLLFSKLEKRRGSNRRHGSSITPRLLAACLEGEVLECTICLQLMAHPTTLTCGHSFCLRCVHSNNKTEQRFRCALCRAPDFLPFYEVDPLIEKLLASITLRLKDSEKRDYEWRRGSLSDKKRLPRIEIGESVSVRQGEAWQSAEVQQVLALSHRLFYKVVMTTSGLSYMMPSNSINLRLSQNPVQRVRRDSGNLFPGVFIEEPALPPINDGYNIEELLWQVNYYPRTTENNVWMFQPEAVQEMEESESFTFLGRFPRPQADVIEID